MDPGAFVVVGLLVGACSVVCFQKGKPVIGSLGLIGIIPGLNVFGVFAVVGAIRYAKPSSVWARKRYTPAQMEESRIRFPGQAPLTPIGPVMAPQGPGADQEPDESPSHETFLVLRFLDRASEAGIIDEPTMVRLADFLTQSAPAPAPENPAPAGRPIQPSLPPLPFEPPRRPEPPDTPEDFAPAPAPIEQPGRGRHVDGARPDRVGRPLAGPIAAWWERSWDAVASEIALHGFAYLGVILTFIGLIGFLFFAFPDLPDASQPFVELGIALVFFVWAWFLRREGAHRVGDAMELIGGMVLPLIVFAGLVDDAPFPPDLTGGALVVALPLVAVALAGLYSLISRRDPRSTLRFLVGPLLWLAAMALGFAFKTDEPLVSEAITRLVSPQPALASVAVALTLVFAVSRPSHRLAAPTVLSALVGVPAAYLLTISLSVGEDWALVWPIVLLGASTFVSAEMVTTWFERRGWMTLARPILLAGVLGPLTAAAGVEWGAVLVVASYLILCELERRASPDRSIGVRLAMAGIGAGLLMSLADPGAALFSFTAAWAWAHVRRLTESDETTRQIFILGAALLPAGMFFGLQGLIGLELAWPAMASLLVALTGYVRLARVDDGFWVKWLLGAPLVLVAGVWAQWYDLGLAGYGPAAALGLAAVALAWGPRWPALRTWLAAGAAGIALFAFHDQLGVSLDTQQVVWSLVGLAAVVAAHIWRRFPADHLGTVGHTVTSLTALSLIGGGDPVYVLGAWAAGWVLAAIGDGMEGDTMTGLLARIPARAGATGGSESEGAALWVVPTFLVVSVPLSLLAAANRWDTFAVNRSWTGALLVTVAIIYATAARGVARKHLRRMLGAGAVALSVIGVSVAAPDPWPTIYAATAVVAVAALLSRDLRQAWFVWFAWSMTVVIVWLLARQAGVPADSRHVITLGWGAVMLLGGLIVDDARAGRRTPGQGLRVTWLRYPVVLGALVFPMSLGPVFIEGMSAAAGWAIGAAAVYLAAALLLRIGAVTAPGYALAAAGVVGLWQRPLTDPWLLVFLAAPMVAISWAAERRRSRDRSGWFRWDLAPLVVAHGVAGLALLYAAVRGGLAPTAAAFGVVSVAIGLWKRGRIWEEAGNLLIVVAGFDLGPGWLALALGATSLRGMLGARLSTAGTRASYQALATAGAGLGLVALLSWLDLAPLEASHYSILAFAGAGLVAAILSRVGWADRDTALWWLGLSVAGASVTAALTLAPAGPGIEGPWFALGLVLLSAGIELAAAPESAGMRLGSVAITGFAWAALLVGLGWGPPEAYDYSGLVFGSLALLVSLLGRFELISPSNATRWGGLSVVVLLVAVASTRSGSGEILFEGPELAIGVALLAAALDLSWRFTTFTARHGAVFAAAVSWGALVVGLRWDEVTTATWTAVVFGLVVFALPELARAGITGDEGSDWYLRRVGLARAWTALGAVGVVLGALLSYAGGDLRLSGYWVAASLALLALAAARGAAPLHVGALREASPVGGIASLLTLAFTAGWADELVAIVTVLIATVSTFAMLSLWRRRKGSPWVRPVMVLSALANTVAAGMAVAVLPDRLLLVGVMLSVGAQAIAVGVWRALRGFLALGPPILAGAFVLSVAESISGTAQWYTAPLGIVVLSEVEIFRSLPTKFRYASERSIWVLLEWVGLGLLSAPPLVEMFALSLFMGLGALGVALAVFLWGVLTRVRRRVIAAAALAIATVVLLLFAAAAGSAPASAFFWIVAIGVGLAVMLVAGFVEAYRSRKGSAMARLAVLMEGWE